MRAWFVLLLALGPAAAEDFDPMETITRDRYQPTIQPVPKSCDDIVARRILLPFQWETNATLLRLDGATVPKGFSIDWRTVAR